jgi:hypothetical protein
MNANLDTNSSCLLPYYSFPFYGINDSDGFTDFYTGASWASFVNCSRAIANDSWYKPVACLSAKNSHVYVWADVINHNKIGDLPPYCRSLNMIPMGFFVEFPFRHFSIIEIINNCVSYSTR